MARMPCRSSVLASSRSVASTPSSTALTVGADSATISAERCDSARRKLSLTWSMSRAKRIPAYCEASCRSRSARRRVFSVSASARRSRSFNSAISLRNPAASSPDSLSRGMSASLSLSARYFALRSGQEFSHDLRGVVHHRNDPGVIQTRRAQHADNANDIALRIRVGRGDDRRAGKAEQPVLRTDENAHAVTQRREFEKPDEIILALYILKKCPD